jgi:hypothetical protein
MAGMGRTGRALGKLGAAVLLAIPLFWAAPPTAGSDVRRYLDPAVRIVGTLPPGESPEAAPSWTTWIAYPMAAVEAVHGLAGGSQAPAARMTEATANWTAVLRGLWAWLLALVLLEAAAFAAAETSAVAGITALALLGISPFAAAAIAHLLPAVPAALLLFLLLRARESWRKGILAGMLLAWFGYLWPLAVLAVGWPMLRPSADAARPSRAGIAWTAGIALFLAFGLIPDRLLHPLSAPARFVAEWRREGGFSGPGGVGWLTLPSLAVMLGPMVWVGWLAAAWRDRRSAAGSMVPAGALLLCLGLPVLLGVRQPGAVQWSVAPLLAAWGVCGVLSLFSFRRRLSGFAVISGLLLAASPIPGRLAWHRDAASAAPSAAAMRAEIATFVGKGDLVVAEADLSVAAGIPNAAAGTDSLGGAAGLLVLPRDSRTPGRYDDLYWHRWYSGFRWVLLSGARVSENLVRPDAVGPRAFYQAVERQGRLVREWGARESGFRLYRIPDDAPWHRPLAETEIAQLRPTPERVWFLSRLGSIYLDAGQLPLAEEVFRLATAWDPENAAAWNNLGAAFLRRDDYAAAAKAFDEGLKRAPQSFELLLNYGRACSAQGIYQRGEGYLLRAADLRPDYAPVHYELARVFIGLDKKALAVAALRRTLALDPSTPHRPEIESVLARLETPPKPRAGKP